MTRPLGRPSNRLMLQKHLTVIFILGLFLSTAAHAQQSSAKRPLAHSDYDSWRAIQGQSLSRDGKFVAYALVPRIRLRRGRQLGERGSRERRGLRGRNRVADVRCRRLLAHHEVAECLDLLAADGLGQDPVLAGLVDLEVGNEDRRHLAGLDLPDPDRLRARVVRANGCAFSCRASQTRAVGRVTSRPCPSTTRKVSRTGPGAKSSLPGTIATSSPGARHNASIELATGSSRTDEEEPPQLAAMRQPARTRAAAKRTRRV